MKLCSLALLAVCVLSPAVLFADPDRHSLWADVLHGEPVTYADVLADLSSADVVYLGEAHTIDRHHEVEAGVISGLAGTERRLVVGMEQLFASHQPQLDRYNRGEISFDELAEAIDWAETWRNYADYREVMEAARAAGAPVVGLNVSREAIMGLARSGLDALPEGLRAQLPDELDLEHPIYDRILSLVMPVHGGMPEEVLVMMRQAQMARDECMADALARFLRSEEGEGRLAVVVCGRWHAAFGLGIPARLRRRMPDATDRIVLMSDSGDLVLSPEEAAMAQEVDISREDLRAIGAPLADYLHLRELAK